VSSKRKKKTKDEGVEVIAKIEEEMKKNAEAQNEQMIEAAEALLTVAHDTGRPCIVSFLHVDPEDLSLVALTDMAGYDESNEPVLSWLKDHIVIEVMNKLQGVDEEPEDGEEDPLDQIAQKLTENPELTFCHGCNAMFEMAKVGPSDRIHGEDGSVIINCPFCDNSITLSAEDVEGIEFTDEDTTAENLSLKEELAREREELEAEVRRKAAEKAEEARQAEKAEDKDAGGKTSAFEDATKK
jgi:hypothetical protein